MVSSLVDSENISISLVIPIFNSEKYISECLDKLINQSLKNIEILCIDYGSIDESKQLITEYSKVDSRIKLFECDNINIARNTGISCAKGEYILFLNPEDWIYINSCELLYDELIKNPCDVLFFKSSLFKEFSKKIYKNSEDSDIDLIQYFVGDNIFDYSDIGDKIFSLPFSLYNKIFNRQFLLSHNLIFQNDAFCDFTFFFEAIMQACKLKIFNKHIYIKRESYNEINPDYFKEIIFDLENLQNYFKSLESYYVFEKNLLNFIVDQIYSIYLSNDENQDEIYLIINNFFNSIKCDKSSYIRYISNLNNENLFFFRDVLESGSNSEFCLLVKYNSLLNENGKLKSEIFKLKKNINQLNDKLAYFE